MALATVELEMPSVTLPVRLAQCAGLELAATVTLRRGEGSVARISADPTLLRQVADEMERNAAEAED